MTENLVSRVSRLVSGGVNSVVDAMENAAPEVVLEQAIREVDSAIDSVRDELGKELAKKHLASTRLVDANGRHEELTTKIGVALKEGREDLAEAAVSRQLDIEAQIPVLEQALAGAGEQEREFEGYTAALQAKKREMQDDLAAFRDSQKSSGSASSDGGAQTASSANAAEDKMRKAEATFDRILQKQTGLPGSRLAGDRKTAAQIAELEEIERTNKIQTRLASIKAAQSS